MHALPGLPPGASIQIVSSLDPGPVVRTRVYLASVEPVGVATAGTSFPFQRSGQPPCEAIS